MNTARGGLPWRRWNVSRDGYAGIAAYTPTEPPRRLQFAWPDAWAKLHDLATSEPRADRAKGALELLAGVYEEFRKRKYAYNIELDPWTDSRGGQAVRDPYAIAYGSGTCIDLAAMFSAICKLVGLRPVIVLLESPDAAHALVVVDLAWGTDVPLDQTGEEPWHAALNPLLAAGSPPDAPGVSDEVGRAVAWSDTPAHRAWRLNGRFVAVEVVGAARENDLDFTAACAEGERILHADVTQKVVAVEVVGANRAGVAEFTVPAEEPGRRALHIDLPDAVGDFHPFPSRAGAEQDLRPGARLVLIGHSGSGKSRLARRVAGMFNDGFGWWLVASGRSTLLGELAEAESRETGLDPALVANALDRKTLADSALRRLDQTAGSWAVVYDNADGDPADIDDLLPSAPKENQLLIVTTNDERWDRPGWQVVRLAEIPSQELAAGFNRSWPEQVRALLGGLPLLAVATERFHEAAGTPWWEIEPPSDGDTAADVPARIWAATVRRLGADSELCRAAEAAAWLPPVDVPLTALAGIVGDPRSAAEIRNYGLADRVPGADPGLRMHRLFRAAVRGASARGSGAAADAAAVASAVLRAEAAFAVLALYFDKQTIEDLHRAVSDPRRDAHEQAIDLQRLGTAVERHDPERAARYLTAARELVHVAGADAVLGDELVRIDVDGLRSLARPAARKLGSSATREQVERALDQAIAWCVEAEDLCAGRDYDHWPMTIARTKALHGIAVRGKGGLHKNADRLYAKRLFEESRELLAESYRVRRELDAGAGGPDVDRAQFNLAGLEIELAQVNPRGEAAAHLAEARRHYAEVLEARRLRLRSDDYEDVACCYNGLAIADYYTAVRTGQSYAEQSESLRRAAQNAAKAADIRVGLHDQDAYDGPDASKSVALLAKISYARVAVNRLASGKGVSYLDSLAEFGLEWGGLAPHSTWLLGADGGAAVVAAPADTPRFAPVPAIGEKPDLRAEIDGWIGSPPLRALVESFAGADDGRESFFDPELGLEQRLVALEVFTDRWDTRGGRERNLSGDLPLTQRQAALVLNAADALGMRSPGVPRQREYHHVILLGGLVRACFLRPAYAARMLARGEVRTGSVVALGARRPLGGDEPDLARALGRPELDEGADEFEALDQGTRAAFGLGAPHSVRAEPAIAGLGPHSGWEERIYQPSNGPRIVVAAAPSRRPESGRADTADAYAWFARSIAKLEPGQRILAVTTDIYRPYQHVAALRMLALPYGVEVETVGHVPAGVEPVLRQPFSPARYLQEIRSAVQGCRALLAAVEPRPEGG